MYAPGYMDVCNQYSKCVNNILISPSLNTSILFILIFLIISRVTRKQRTEKNEGSTKQEKIKLDEISFNRHVDYQKWKHHLNLGQEEFRAFVEKEFFDHGKDDADISVFFQLPGRTDFVPYEFVREFYETIANDELAYFYIDKFLIENIKPVSDKKKAATQLKRLLLTPEYATKLSAKYNWFGEIYELHLEQRDLSSLKTKFRKKSKLVTDRKLDRHLANHMFDLAEMYINGIACKKDLDYAKNLINDAIVISKETMNDNNNIDFIKKCNELLKLF